MGGGGEGEKGGEGGSQVESVTVKFSAGLFPRTLRGRGVGPAQPSLSVDSGGMASWGFQGFPGPFVGRLCLFISSLCMDLSS